jgi:hypothetical protein
VVFGDQLIMHGGHDGTRHLQDTHVFHFPSQTWSALIVDGPSPAPRDSHVAVVFNDIMLLYGGSTGSAMGDFHALSLTRRHYWRSVQSIARPSVSSTDIPVACVFIVFQRFERVVALCRASPCRQAVDSVTWQ